MCLRSTITTTTTKRLVYRTTKQRRVKTRKPHYSRSCFFFYNASIPSCFHACLHKLFRRSFNIQFYLSFAYPNASSDKIRKPLERFFQTELLSIFNRRQDELITPFKCVNYFQSLNGNVLATFRYSCDSSQFDLFRVFIAVLT